MTTRIIAPTHPGVIIKEEFLEPLDMSQRELARRLNVDPRRVNELIHGKRGITADTAMRLSTLFGTTASFWLNLQTRYELDVAKDQAGRIRDEVQPLESA
jgi:addiction module HigA family antidote